MEGPGTEAPEWQQRVKTELGKLDAAQKEYARVVSQRKVLEGQLNENRAVSEELTLLKEDARLFKMIGPALVPQDSQEVRLNVAKRIEYIGQEIARQDKLIGDINKRIEAHSITLNEAQKMRPTPSPRPVPKFTQVQ